MNELSIEAHVTRQAAMKGFTVEVWLVRSCG